MRRFGIRLSPFMGLFVCLSGCFANDSQCHDVPAALSVAVSPNGAKVVAGYLLYPQESVTNDDNDPDTTDDDTCVTQYDDPFGALTLYNAEEKGFSHHYRGDVAPVDQVSYSYDGNLVAFLVRGSPYITLFDTRTNETFRSWRISQNRVTALAFAPNSLNLAVASESAVTIWNGQTGELRETFVWAGGARCLTYSHDGRFLVGGGADGTVRLWALRDGNRERVLNAHSGAVLSLCFLAGRDVVASGGADRDIHLFDANTGNLLNTLIEHDDAVTALIGTPDGNTLVSGGLDERIRIWDAKTGKLQRTILFFTPVASLATFPDGKRFVAAGFRDSLTVWDIATGQIVRRL